MTRPDSAGRACRLLAYGAAREPLIPLLMFSSLMSGCASMLPAPRQPPPSRSPPPKRRPIILCMRRRRVRSSKRWCFACQSIKVFMPGTFSPQYATSWMPYTPSAASWASAGVLSSVGTASSSRGRRRFLRGCLRAWRREGKDGHRTPRQHPSFVTRRDRRRRDHLQACAAGVHAARARSSTMQRRARQCVITESVLARSYSDEM